MHKVKQTGQAPLELLPCFKTRYLLHNTQLFLLQDVMATEFLYKESWIHEDQADLLGGLREA